MANATLVKNGHKVTTSNPAEAVKLRSLGYEDVAPKPKSKAPKAEAKVIDSIVESVLPEITN